MTTRSLLGRGTIAVAIAASLVTALGTTGSAHKPITSPFTYNDDVFPILRKRCGACHVSGGVAPMSLMSHEDAVPWGESMRVELLAGHMPPWSVDAGADQFQNAESLTPREMDLLLTWATGGTPYGTPEKAPQQVQRAGGWALGAPDLQLQLPHEITLPANKQADTADFVLPVGTQKERALLAVDLLPGTPEIVRSAVIAIKSPHPSGTSASSATESVLATWLPGDPPVRLSHGAGFDVPPGAELAVRVRYKKTWQFERKEMHDRSTVGLYFATGQTTSVQALELTSGSPDTSSPGTKRFMTHLTSGVRALAIYPGERLADVGVVVTAMGPDGARTQLIAFHPRAGWARRFWYRAPIWLPAGTTIETRVSATAAPPTLPLLGSPVAAVPTGRDDVRLTLNVLAGA